MQWHEAPVYSDRFALLYGIDKPATKSGFKVGEQWVTQLDTKLWLQDKKLADCYSELLGAAKLAEAILIVCRSSFLIVEPSAEIVEHSFSMPNNIQQMYVLENNLYIASHANFYKLDKDLMEWTHIILNQLPPPVEALPLPLRLQNFLAQQIPIPGINLEKLLLDLHSGRLFGAIGVWIVNLVALVICFLVLSGIYFWYLRLFKKRQTMPGKQHHRSQDT